MRVLKNEGTKVDHSFQIRVSGMVYQMDCLGPEENAKQKGIFHLVVWRAVTQELRGGGSV